MPLQSTGLVIVSAPLDPAFCGNLGELQAALTERFKVMSPSGIAFFSQGDVLPASDVGLFLLGGTQLYVFDADQGQYVPLDISASENPDFFVGPNDPGTPPPEGPNFWLRTNNNRVVGLYGWDGSAWKASANIDHSGTTAQRPLSPTDLEHYFDTDISTELIFERGDWRTVSGSKGDLKFVIHPTLAEALRHSPGWAWYGQDDQTIRGRALAGAVKDPGATPASSFVTDSGITPRAAGEKFGEENHILSSPEHEPHCHSVGCYAPADSNGLRFHREENADVLATPAPIPPNHVALSGDGRVTGAGVAGPGGAGEGLITSGQFLKSVAPAYTGVAAGHNTVPPTVYQWCLVKL